MSTFEITKDDYFLVKADISNHPNFSEISREVVIDDIQIIASDNFTRGYYLQYFINHYDKEGNIEKSFIPTSTRWIITDSLLIAQRDFTKPELPPITNPEYTKALAGNKLSKEIDNPEYDPTFTSSDDSGIILPEDEIKLLAKIPNPDYVSDEDLALISEYVMLPAFTYILRMSKQYPALIWNLITFYIYEQDKDKFFDTY